MKYLPWGAPAEPRLENPAGSACDGALARHLASEMIGNLTDWAASARWPLAAASDGKIFLDF